MSETLRILVVDDDPSMARTLMNIFEVKGHTAEIAHSGAEALERVAQSLFDCVLSDIKMPEVNGVELYRAIRAQQPELPVVLMTAYASDSLVRDGLEEGVVAVLTKPLDIGLLLTFFSFLCNERSVVIVDDDPLFCKTLGSILRMRGFAVSQIIDPYEVMEQLEEDTGVVLLDMKLNSINGFDVLQDIRMRHPHQPVILVTGYRAEMNSAIQAALKIGAYACLYKPFEVETLVELLTELRHQELGRVLGKH